MASGSRVPRTRILGGSGIYVRFVTLLMGVGVVVDDDDDDDDGLVLFVVVAAVGRWEDGLSLFVLCWARGRVD